MIEGRAEIGALLHAFYLAEGVEGGGANIGIAVEQSGDDGVHHQRIFERLLDLLRCGVAVEVVLILGDGPT